MPSPERHETRSRERARLLRAKPPAVTLRAPRRGERGYTLVALLALMTVMMLAVTAAAPSLRQQSQRNLEEEAIARGEEVAAAIRLYALAKNQLPTSIDQLLEGVNVGTKKVQIMRPFAARDPLTEDGEWRLIKETDRALIDFQLDLTRYADNRPVQPKPLPGVRGLPRVTGIVDTGSREERPCDEVEEPTLSGGPFVGVASASTRESVIAYFGIQCHSQWVFTPLFLN
ncbi:MAG TPA: type II secretion system protein [Pyrinomonadaceae bacterium]|nr:type II secretion system protein [Pyrinomonadaceae bacterium]